MSLTVEASGSVALVVANPETTLATITTNRIMTLVVDLASANSSDSFIVRCSAKVLNTGVIRDFILATLVGGTTEKIYVSIPMDSPWSATFKIQQSAGTNRTIPWRLDSFGSVTVTAEGTQLSSGIGSEDTLATVAAGGNYSLVVDLTNMGSADTVEVHVKQRVLSGGTTRDEIVATYSGVQAVPLVQSIPISSVYEFSCSIKQTAGTVKSFDWSLHQLS